MCTVGIRFPNLGLDFKGLDSSISLFGVDIACYGIVIAIAMFLGYVVAAWQARRTKQNKEVYLDFAMIAIVVSVIGARIYYAIFNWSIYQENPLSVFNLKKGGLALYGAVIAAVITAFLYTKAKKLNFWLFCDTAMFGLLTGQVVGRWANFVNRDAFGDYTNNLFAMQLLKSEVDPSAVTQKMLDHITWIGGRQYIQVHPTFLYESVWNLALLILLLIYAKHKKADGELMALYLIGYGVGRLWIERLRTDKLLLWGTNLPISQIFSGVAILVGIILIVYRRKIEKVKK